MRWKPYILVGLVISTNLVIAKPTAILSISPIEGQLQIKVDGSQSEPIGEIKSYIWTTTPDGQVLDKAQGTLSFEKAGTYKIILEVIDNEGLSGTNTQTVTVGEDGNDSQETLNACFEVTIPEKTGATESGEFTIPSKIFTTREQLIWNLVKVKDAPIPLEIKLDSDCSKGKENIRNYEWIVSGKEEPIYGSRVSHFFYEKGFYNITLIVTDNNGKNDEVTKSFMVGELCVEVADFEEYFVLQDEFREISFNITNCEHAIQIKDLNISAIALDLKEDCKQAEPIFDDEKTGILKRPRNSSRSCTYTITFTATDKNDVSISQKKEIKVLTFATKTLFFRFFKGNGRQANETDIEKPNAYNPVLFYKTSDALRVDLIVNFNTELLHCGPKAKLWIAIRVPDEFPLGEDVKRDLHIKGHNPITWSASFENDYPQHFDLIHLSPIKTYTLFDIEKGALADLPKGKYIFYATLTHQDETVPFARTICQDPKGNILQVEITIDLGSWDE